MDERLFWIGLNMVKGIGPVRFRALLERFGDVQSVWEAAPSAWREAGLSDTTIENFIQTRANADLLATWKQIQANNITLLTWNDEQYPRRLKEIDQPPPVLYAKGKIIEQDDWAVAMVGTRGLSQYGKQVADEIATYLAQQGITIVSGMARGIDSVAHKAALKAGGRTIAVLGSGVDVLYPPENKNLALQIMEQGAVISDYAVGTPPEANNFPPRNRIISGLSLAVVVVEAGKKSGALITANFAADQGREVFAVPGSIYTKTSMGPNELIRNGAHPLLSPEDIMLRLELEMVTEKQAARHILPGNAAEAALFATLDHEPRHVDEICQQAGLPIEEVSATLTVMELKGLVRQVGGMQYVAVREARANYDAQTNNE